MQKTNEETRQAGLMRTPNADVNMSCAVAAEIPSLEYREHVAKWIEFMNSNSEVINHRDAEAQRTQEKTGKRRSSHKAISGETLCFQILCSAEKGRSS